jgi:DNA-binding response OmpR family regulator
MKKILLIEDDATMVTLLKMLLGLEGYQVVNLSSENQDIIQLAYKETPDLILLDIHLGQQNGLDLIKKLKNNIELRRIKVIMTSGMDLGESCLSSGADDFILKPYMPEELLNKIKNLLLVVDEKSSN